MRAYLTISREGGAAPPTAELRKLLRAAAKQALLAADFGLDAEISLLLTDDEGIRGLNRDYRGQDKATDVLSFPLFEAIYEPGASGPGQPRAQGLAGEEADYYAPGFDAGPALLGDIVISCERAAVQAAELGQEAKRETVFLFVHGMLHLLGYDHERGQEAEEEMFAIQTKIMKELGI